MMKNSALLMLTFAMLAFCPPGRAQDQEPNIDSTIAVVRANIAGRQGCPHHCRNEFHGQRWRGILADLSAIRVRTIQAG